MKRLMIFKNKDKFNDYKITTVIPVYNQEKHLEKALKSYESVSKKMVK